MVGRLFYFSVDGTIFLVYLISWRNIFPTQYSVQDSQSTEDLRVIVSSSGDSGQVICTFVFSSVIKGEL